MRRQRSEIGPAQQILAADTLARHLCAMSVVAEARHIGLYLANDGEIDPEPFMHWSFTQAKHCYLPVLDGGGGRVMKFAEITPVSEFKPNKFGIPEPVVEPHQLVGADALDTILIPLVAFDPEGNRVGMGGGFYDRTLAFTHDQTYDQRPKLIGLAHAFQCVEAIEPAPWDIPLDGVVTEKRSILFHPQAG